MFFNQSIRILCHMKVAMTFPFVHLLRLQLSIQRYLYVLFMSSNKTSKIGMKNVHKLECSYYHGNVLNVLGQSPRHICVYH